MSGGPVRVLVVDDSAFARKVIREVLSKDPRLEVVGFARDGLEALERIAELDPDVVTLDLVMPHLDGIGVLSALRAPRPRVVAVSVSGPESELGLEALDRGAVDLVAKPTSLATDRLYELSADLREKVFAAACARSPAPAAGGRPLAPLAAAARPAGRVRLIVVGTSTGGPQALTRLLSALPAGLPPVAVALHIPAGFTEALARRLARASALRVREAADGEPLSPGDAVLAPGGSHLRIDRAHGELVARVAPAAGERPYVPSVDLLFESAADTVGGAALGVVLTGMGNDGTGGAARIRAAGGRILGQAEESCTIFGMPRALHEAGLAEALLPLDDLPAAIVRAAGER